MQAHTHACPCARTCTPIHPHTYACTSACTHGRACARARRRKGTRIAPPSAWPSPNVSTNMHIERQRQACLPAYMHTPHRNTPQHTGPHRIALYITAPFCTVLYHTRPLIEHVFENCGTATCFAYGQVACLYTCLDTCPHACLHTYLYTCLHTYLYTGLHTCLHTCLGRCLHTCLDRCLSTCLPRFASCMGQGSLSLA